MKFNLHHGDYPFPQIQWVTIDADNEEQALERAIEWHASKDNPHPVVSEQVESRDGHVLHH